HGEAVAIGMLIAADLSARLGLIDREAAARLRALLERAGLPVAAPAIGADRARTLMQMDKKVRAGALRLVLLDALGNAVVTADYDESALTATLTEYFA
ncbi:MAG: 3-dehydroquinate synthase, partial [Gammaproteobacteria bacterium]|nr:3-dehydroquinate synthase [Gammaproteobacteria bacterium]